MPKPVMTCVRPRCGALKRTLAAGVHDDLACDIERVALHDVTALRRIQVHFGGKLGAVCLRITGCGETAEDALQECYIKLWNRAESYDRSRSRPIVWLGTLARNCAIDLARYQRRTRVASLPSDYDAVDTSPPADHCLIEQERQARAVALLETLGLHQREHIRDIYLNGLSYSELSEHHGIPVSTIKSRTYRGLMAMKRAWNVD
jgi:RNA polymerase sigma-70 factor (ECF subfamily)